MEFLKYHYHHIPKCLVGDPSKNDMPDRRPIGIYSHIIKYIDAGYSYWENIRSPIRHVGLRKVPISKNIFVNSPKYRIIFKAILDHEKISGGGDHEKIRTWGNDYDRKMTFKKSCKRNKKNFDGKFKRI